MNTDADLRKKNIRLGLFILAGTLILCAGILMVGNIHETFVKKIRIYARIADVEGLQAGNNIWFSGVKIGTVSRLEFKPGAVEVTMRVDQKVQPYIYSNAMVKLAKDGLIGNRILVIFGGTPGVRTLQEGDTLRFLQGTRTEDVMRTLEQNNDNLLAITRDLKILTQKLAEGKGSAGRLLTEDELYEGLLATVDDLRVASAHARSLLASASDVGTQIRTPGNLVQTLIGDTNVSVSVKNAVSRLENVADTASAMMTELKSAQADRNSPLGKLLRDTATGRQLESAVNNLEKGTALLNADLEALKHSIFFRRYFRKLEKSSRSR